MSEAKTKTIEVFYKDGFEVGDWATLASGLDCSIYMSGFNIPYIWVGGSKVYIVNDRFVKELGLRFYRIVEVKPIELDVRVIGGLYGDRTIGVVVDNPSITEQEKQSLVNKKFKLTEVLD